MARKPSKKTTKKSQAPVANNYLSKLENDFQTNQSKVSMILGALILLVLGILIFNYFNRNQASLGPAQNTQGSELLKEDTTPDKLPGKYTVKEGDSLFEIAMKYYGDGYKYTEIVKVNNLIDANQIETGQVLDIPKLENTNVVVEVASVSAQVSPPSSSVTPPINTDMPSDWGSRIYGDTYTVQAGDWLSTIAARAYGDIYSFDKIAKANNIVDPNIIEPGTNLKIPR